MTDELNDECYVKQTQQAKGQRVLGKDHIRCHKEGRI